MHKQDIGVIGLAVMGANLARNMASHTYRVAIYNRSEERTDALLAQHGNEYLQGYYDLKVFVQSLARPRKIVIMVKAGAPVDDVIATILPYLQKGDVIIDGGNSYYRDTERRHRELAPKGIHFVGAGISGGEEGALRGPSIMPGGTKESWKVIQPIFEAIAAKDFAGKPCVTHVGTGAAGHYVKMVHNGIEYAIMQLLAEAYDMMRTGGKMKPSDIADVFAEWNKGKLKSFLVEIMVPVLSKKDDKRKGFLVDSILDVAGAKGTGKWTSQDALDRGVAVPSIAEAVFARAMSANKKQRQVLGLQFPSSRKLLLTKDELITHLEQALYVAILSAYAQGYDLIRTANTEEKWGVNLSQVSRIWQGGCIIRAKVLRDISSEFAQKGMKDAHLFMLPKIQSSVKKGGKHLRVIVGAGIQANIPMPAFSSALSYIDSSTTAESSANIIQGLRDYFGAHTYQRKDKRGTFHTDWS